MRYYSTKHHHDESNSQPTILSYLGKSIKLKKILVYLNVHLSLEM